MYAWRPPSVKETQNKRITTYTTTNIKYLQFSVEMLRELILGRELDKGFIILSTIFHEFGDFAEMCVNV